jgi:hypothetical protein
MKRNLVVLHLESIAWQALNAFPQAFPNLRRIMLSARAYRWYFSSATSTQMVLAYLFHSNDFEFDAAGGLEKPAANNPSLFATVRDAGYRTEFLCLSSFETKAMLPLLAETLGPISTTNDYRELERRFAAATAERPFAIYVWNLVTHVEHTLALAPHAEGLDEIVGGACAVADHVLGALIGLLERSGLIDETTIVVFGDHGDDCWTHGFKKGILHGIEPYTHMVHAPLMIRDAALPPGDDRRLASTIDVAPTCLDLLGLAREPEFAFSGRSLLREPPRDCAFAQNFAGNQPDNADWDIRKSFSAHNRAHSLLVTSRGLELFNHRLDPTNHCNLLHFFDLDSHGGLALRAPEGFAHPHFAAAMRYVLGNKRATGAAFARLRAALAERVGRKRAYIAARNPAAQNMLDPACLETINRHDRDRFYGRTGPPERPAAEAPVAASASPPGEVIAPLAAAAPIAEAASEPPARPWFGGLVDAVLRRNGHARP